MPADLLIKLGVAGFFFFFILNLAGIQTWVERKQSALMQDRIGANRAEIFGLRIIGLFHPLADVIKLITKEDFVPIWGDRILHTLAPFLSVFFALATFAAIPFGPDLHAFGRIIPLQIANIDVGLLFIFGMMSLGVYGVFLAGISSRSNYAFLGSMRAAAQLLSYEITMGMSLMGIVIVYHSLNLSQIVVAQGRLIGGFLPAWGIFLQPIAFFVFMTAALAETKRVPFDLPEGESEIIGYFTEYSGMKFGLFFLTDFIETVLVACLVTTLFFGGWQVPFMNETGIHFPWGAEILLPHLGTVLLGILSFMTKVIVFCWLFMTVRWTLPRFRYDQLMRLGWKMLFPISVANLFITGVLYVWIHRIFA